MGRVKAYVCLNHDGRHSTAVAATSLKEAAAKLSVSQHHMRDFGWYAVEAHVSEAMTLVVNNPTMIYRAPLSGADRGNYKPWCEAAS